MRFGTLATTIVGLTGLLAMNALAKEKALKKSELPAAVQKTADEQSKDAVIRGYSSEVEGGALQYEVAMTVAGHTREVSIAPDGRIVPPVDVVRHDADDPYLVVAADKGTATFSDIANGISRDCERQAVLMG